MSEITDIKSKVDAEAEKAKQAAMGKLNEEESWTEKNPVKVNAIILALIVLGIICLVKSCA